MEADIMPIHQLELAKRAKNETRPERVNDLLAGKASLAAALDVDETVLAAYRRQAEVLFRANKWRASADVIEGLVALDAAGTEEIVLLARAYEALGDHDKAAAIGAVLSNVLLAMEGRSPAAPAALGTGGSR